MGLKDRGVSLPAKIVSICLSVVVAFCGITYAAPEDLAYLSDLPESVSLVDIDDIGVALNIGNVRSSFRGNNGKTIVHIQDAHCNYEAQTNINRLLEQFTGEYGIDLISVEGAEGTVDTSWFRAFPDAEIRREVADYFMKKGELTGAEFFSITSDFQGIMYGAEDREHYIANLKAFKEVFPYQQGIEDYFKGLDNVFNRLKSMAYSPELRFLDNKITAFKDRQLELVDYAFFLEDFSDKHGVLICEYPDLQTLLKTLSFERKIDFDIVNQERTDYIELVKEKLDSEGMSELVGKSLEFKKGRIRPADFYTYLRDLAREQDIQIVHEFPNLFHYYIYSRLYAQIDTERLFDQLDSLERELKDTLFTSQAERDLDRFSEMTRMHINLVNIKLTNGDYDRFQKYNSQFTVRDTVDFLRRMCTRYGLRHNITADVPDEVIDKVPNMIDFYEIAMKRDEVLIQNTLRKMKEEGRDTSILIAGGFHTRGITELLRKEGVSYVVATPRITEVVDSPYIEVLTNQRTTIADMITDSSAVPGAGAVPYSSGITQMAGELLQAPLRAGSLVRDLFKAPKKLAEFSDAVGPMHEGGQTLEELAVSTVMDFVREYASWWFVRERALDDERGWDDAWDTFVKEVTQTLRREFPGDRYFYFRRDLLNIIQQVIGELDEGELTALESPFPDGVRHLPRRSSTRDVPRVQLRVEGLDTQEVMVLWDDPVALPDIIGERPVIVRVLPGQPVSVIGADGVEMARLSSEEEFVVEDITGVTLRKAEDAAHGPAEVELLYEKDGAEDLVYSVYAFVADNIEKILDEKTDIAFDQRIFAGTGKPGMTANDIQRLVNRYIQDYLRIAMEEGMEIGGEKIDGEKIADARNHVRILEYDKDNVENLVENLIFRKGARQVLGITKEAHDKYGDAFTDFVENNRRENLRILPLPAAPEIVGEGSFFALDLVGTALAQATLTKEDIEGKATNAENFERLMREKWGVKNIDINQLYFFLPFGEVSSTMEDAFPEASTVDGFLIYLMKYLLPVEPIVFDKIRDQIESRRQIQWSA